MLKKSIVLLVLVALMVLGACNPDPGSQDSLLQNVNETADQSRAAVNPDSKYITIKGPDCVHQTERSLVNNYVKNSSYSYDDGTYAGTLKGVYHIVCSEFNPAYNVYIVKFTIVYGGIVYLKKPVVNRLVNIQLPSYIFPGQTFTVLTSASTNAKDNEQIGFYHMDYSLNGGRTWTAVCYDVNVGKTAVRNFNLTAGAADSVIKVRLRIAYRWGGAGDVDYKGAPIDWNGTWDNWVAPPAKYAQLTVSR